MRLEFLTKDVSRRASSKELELVDTPSRFECAVVVEGCDPEPEWTDELSEPPLRSELSTLAVLRMLSFSLAALLSLPIVPGHKQSIRWRKLYVWTRAAAGRNDLCASLLFMRGHVRIFGAHVGARSNLRGIYHDMAQQNVSKKTLIHVSHSSVTTTSLTCSHSA